MCYVDVADIGQMIDPASTFVLLIPVDTCGTLSKVLDVHVERIAVTMRLVVATIS